MKSLAVGIGQVRFPVLATASSQPRVSSIALEALVSVAEAPSVPTSSNTASMVMALGA